MISGFILIDKPSGVTSFGVVSRIRKLTGEKKVGHGGTLDPLATGLLVVAVGKATKQLGGLLGADKEYEVLAQFGAVSDTYDADGRIEIVDQAVFEGLKEFFKEEVEEIIRKNFMGEIAQIPPAFSALKIGGKRAYSLARMGFQVELKARKLTIYDFEILEFKWPRVRFKVRCSSGTYIRSLVHDLGQKLGCGAYVKELRRTKIAEYEIENAVPLEVLDSENILNQVFVVKND